MTVRYVRSFWLRPGLKMWLLIGLSLSGRLLSSLFTGLAGSPS